MSAKLLTEFLKTQGVNVVYGGNLNDILSNNFHFLNELILRRLVEEALKYRDESLIKSNVVDDKYLLGYWGEIIDAVHIVTQNKRNVSMQNLQKLVSLGNENDPKKVVNAIKLINKSKQIDFIFEEMLRETFNQCRNGGQEQEDNAAMFQFFCDVVQKIKSIPTVEDDSGIANNNDYHIDKKKQSVESCIQSFNEVNINQDEETLSEDQANKLIVVGEYLRELIATGNGDVTQLQSRIIYDIKQTRKVDPKLLKIVLKDNIDACLTAGYTNKGKLFSFLMSIIDSMDLTDIEEMNNIPIDNFTTIHVPKFIDDVHIHDILDGTKFITQDKFIDVSGLSSMIMMKDVKNHKKKSNNRDAKQKIKKSVEIIGSHLQQHGWVVCDNFIPLDLVRRVRIEAGLFKEHYEQSEIWVGKRADVGAHLSVPSVRGDKVLWMCGAHNAPEGVSRVVKTKGEIEPCKLEIKAQSAIKNFLGLKELVHTVDNFIDHLKPNVAKLSRIYERSDAMLAIYPGAGSRFARHIDNTTNDGRRITVLVYLNPNWQKEHGGAVRLSPLDSPENAIDVYPESGRLLIFYSSQIPHEVLPTFGERHAITMWYYDTDERKAALLDAEKTGSALGVQSTGVESQREAKQFIADLMGGDLIGDDGGDPSIEELANLSDKVKKLSAEALGIVSSITGAPSADSFKVGFELLKPVDLKQMRKLFRRMGLN